MDQSGGDTPATVIQPNNQPQTTSAPQPTPAAPPEPAQPVPSPSAPISPADSQPPTVPAEPPKKSKKPLIIILVVVLLLAMAGAAYWWFVARDKNTQTATNAEVVKKEIPQLRIATSQGAPQGVYPGGQGFIPDIELIQQTFEGLVHFEEGTKIKPLLATSWTNPDDETWVFTLRKNVKFHTGRTMTAEDVKYSFDNFKDSYWYSNNGLAIKSVKVVDDDHIEIKTDGPDPVLLNKLTLINIVDSKSTFKEDIRNGTGPYTSAVAIKSPEKQKEIELVPFDEYWGGKPMVRSITFKYYQTSEEADAAYKKGDIDILETDTSNEALASILRPSDKTVEYSNLAVFYLGFNFNLKTSPTAKEKVREAIYLATDPEALIKARKASGVVASQILPIEVPGYNPAITRPARNVEKAKALLKEAGYPKGVTIKLSYYPTSQNAAEEIARELKEAGITLKLDPQGDATYDQVVYGGGAEMFFAGAGTNNLDGSSGFVTEFQDTPNFSDKTVDAMINEAQSTLDQEKRLKILQDISKKLMDDLRWIPLYTSTGTLAVKKSYVISQDVYGTGLGIYLWKVYDQ